MSSLAFDTATAVDSRRASSGLKQAGVMTVRCLRLTSRKLDALITAIVLPIILMLLFVYLFGGAIQTGTDYVTYVVPGVLLLCAGFGASTTAVSVSEDMHGGIIDRFRSLDIGGLAVLTGQVVTSVIRNIISTVLVFGVAFLIGFRPEADALGWLAAGGILLLFMLAMSWFSAAIGLLAKSAEAANGFTFFVMFLPYASSAFVPINTMPSWLQGFARHQPVTPVTEAIRGFLLGTPTGDNAWIALVWCAAIIVVSCAACAALYRRRTA
jgi:ABC-2 type transport system permease protein